MEFLSEYGMFLAKAVTLVAAALVVIINILTDIVYRMIDPRIRVGGAKS